jgi:hypothetical protein
MKSIGYIESGGNTEQKYIGGSIVMLTQREMALLLMLQDAWDGAVFRWPPAKNEKLSDDNEMSDIFKAIHCFIEAKLAINEFKKTIDDLNDLIMENKNEL